MMIEIPLKRRGLVYCDECAYLSVQNTKYLYAICQRHGIEFKPFEDDTRTHYCAWGVKAEQTEPQILDDIGRQIQDAYDKGIISDADATQAWYEAVNKTEPQTDMAEDIVESFGFKAESYRQAKAKNEPQTEYRRVGQAIDSVTGKVLGETYDVPQTERSE